MEGWIEGGKEGLVDGGREDGKEGKDRGNAEYEQSRDTHTCKGQRRGQGLHLIRGWVL